MALKKDKISINITNICKLHISFCGNNSRFVDFAKEFEKIGIPLYDCFQDYNNLLKSQEHKIIKQIKKLPLVTLDYKINFMNFSYILDYANHFGFFSKENKQVDVLNNICNFKTGNSAIFEKDEDPLVLYEMYGETINPYYKERYLISIRSLILMMKFYIPHNILSTIILDYYCILTRNLIM
jgi:hypothetical protein